MKGPEPVLIATLELICDLQGPSLVLSGGYPVTCRFALLTTSQFEAG